MRGGRWLALSALLTSIALAQTSAPEDPASAFRACAAVEAPAERLACYDHVSGRDARESAPRATADAPSPALPAPKAAPAATDPAPKAAPAPAPTGSFGLYAAEHPVPPPAASSLTGRVQALGRSSRGRPTVTLDNGALWELDDSDPLLAVGDVVTIRRAALQSFILETPSKRRHRALRLQ